MNKTLFILFINLKELLNFIKQHQKRLKHEQAALELLCISAG